MLRALGGALLLVASPAFAINLLDGKKPAEWKGINEPERLTDGKAGFDGDFWNSTRTTQLFENGFVKWDLGEPKRVHAAMIQADNNDEYVLEGSVDNQTWAVVWKALPMPEGGIQTRITNQNMDFTARYLRLTANGGDKLFAISELSLFENPGEATPNIWQRSRGKPPAEGPTAVLWFLTVLAIVALVRANNKLYWLVASPVVATLVFYTVVSFLQQIRD